MSMRHGTPLVPGVRMRPHVALAIALTSRSRAALHDQRHLCDLEEVDHVAAAIERLRRGQIDALVLDTSEESPSAADLDALRADAPHVPKILLGEPGQADALVPLAEHQRFTFLSLSLPADALASALQKLLRPRTGQRQSLAAHGLEIRGSIEGRAFRHRLQNLSNQGLAFTVDGGAPIRGFATRSVIEDLELVDVNGTCVLRQPRAVVRQARFEEADGERCVHVGVEFELAAAARPARVKVLSEALHVAAALRKAGRAGAEITLQLPDAERGWLVGATELEVGEAPALRFACETPAELRLHDVVRLSFDHHGLSYSGLATVTALAPALALSLPRSLRVHHRRNARRLRVPENAGYSVHLTAPAVGLDQAFPLLELHGQGLSIRADSGRDLLPPGLRVGLDLRVPGESEPLRLSAIVRNFAALAAPADEPSAPARCGLELLAPLPREHDRLTAVLVRAGLRNVEAATGDDFDDIWELLDAARFRMHLYAGEEGRRIVEHAYRAVSGSSGQVGVGLVYRAENRLHGHISGLRAFERTWIVTHLAAIQGSMPEQERVSRALCIGMGEHVERQEHADYVRLVYRRDQRWVSHMFGWSGRTVQEPGLAECRDFMHLVRRTELPLQPPSRGLQFRDARDDELALVERHFVETVSTLRIRSEDLDRSSLRLAQVGAAWASAGLSRRRQVRLALLDGVPVGFSLLEEATPAVQLSELLSGFDVHALPRSQPLLAGALSEEAVCEELLRDAVAWYVGRGRPFAVALIEDRKAPLFVAAGFEVAARSRVWTWHRSLLRAWADVWNELFLSGEATGGRALPSRSAA